MINLINKIGANQEQKAQIHASVKKALDFALDKRNAKNAGQTSIEASFSNVGDYIKALLNSGNGLGQGAILQVQSFLNGLNDGLKSTLQGDDLIKGLIGSVQGSFDGLSVAVIIANVNNARGVLKN